MTPGVLHASSARPAKTARSTSNPNCKKGSNTMTNTTDTHLRPRQTKDVGVIRL
jgi:hypothetical protein